MARISDLHKKWMKDSKYRKAYVALEEEFALASAVIEARSRAGDGVDGHAEGGQAAHGGGEVLSAALDEDEAQA